MRRAVILCALAFASCAFAPLIAANDLRDPTRPPQPKTTVATAHESAPVLSAIIGTNAGRIAILNGQLVRSGGSVGTYFIETVFVDGIRYRHAGLTRDLYLPHIASFKSPSTAPARLAAGVH